MPAGRRTGAPFSPIELGQQRRLPQGEGAARARRPVLAHRDDRSAGEARRERGRVRHGGRGEHQRRCGAVPRAHPQQPSQQQRDVRAEHPAVGVALVDDDVAQPAQERRPAGVSGQHGAVQHVRVAEHPAARAAGPVALVERGVAVERGGPHVREVELGEGAQLVGGQRLGRREVQGGGPRVGGERGEHRQLVGQRLAGRGAGRHHDVLPGVGQLGRVHLVGPRRAHAVVDQRVADRRGHPARPVRDAPGPGGHPHHVAQRGEFVATRHRAAVGERRIPGERGGAARRPVLARRAIAAIRRPSRGEELGHHAVRCHAGAREHARQQVGPAPLRGSACLVHGHRAHGHRRWHTSRPREVPTRPFGQTSRTTRGMSQRCHEHPSERRDDQGSRPARSVIATVTGAGGRVPPEQPGAVAHLHCDNPVTAPTCGEGLFCFRRQGRRLQCPGRFDSPNQEDGWLTQASRRA